jgi:hypothetical protein
LASGAGPLPLAEPLIDGYLDGLKATAKKPRKQKKAHR